MKKTNKKIALILVVLLLLTAVFAVTSAVMADSNDVTVAAQTALDGGTAKYELTADSTIKNITTTKACTIDLKGYQLVVDGTWTTTSTYTLTVVDTSANHTGRLSFASKAAVVDDGLVISGATANKVNTVEGLNILFANKTTKATFAAFKSGDNTAVNKYVIGDLKSGANEQAIGTVTLASLTEAAETANVYYMVSGKSTVYDADLATIAGANITFNHAGTVTLYKIVKDANYDVWYATGSKTVDNTLTYKSYTITVKPFDNATFTATLGGSVAYTGSAITPVTAVKANKPVDDTVLTLNKDYTIAYENNTNAGTNTAKYTITGINDYAGSKLENATFSITAGAATGTLANSIPDQEYTGSAIEPSFSVSVTKTVKDAYGADVVTTKVVDLNKNGNEDFDVSYGNWVDHDEDAGTPDIWVEGATNVGTYSIKLAGKGNFAGSTFTLNNAFKVKAKKLSTAPTVKFYKDGQEVTSYEYGAAVPTLHNNAETISGTAGNKYMVLVDGKALKATDLAANGVMNLTKNNNLYVGDVEATVTMAAGGNYNFEEFKTTFAITEKTEGVNNLTLTVVNRTAGQLGIDKDSMTIYDTDNEVYTVTYLGNEAKIDDVINGFLGTKITAKTDDEAAVVPVLGRDLLVTYTNNDAGNQDATVTLKPTGAYIGSPITLKFKTVNPTTVSLGITVDYGKDENGVAKTAYDYTGSAITPKVKVVNYVTTELKEGKDYSLTVTNNVDAGKGKIKVNLLGSFAGITPTKGTDEKEFDIAPADLAKATVTLNATEFTYTGSVIKPTATVTMSGKTLTEGTDYTVTEITSKNVGKNYEFTVNGIGNYKGSNTAKYNIVAKAANLTIKPIADIEYTNGVDANHPDAIMVMNGSDVLDSSKYDVFFDDHVYTFNDDGTVKTNDYKKDLDVTGTRTVRIKTKKDADLSGEATATYTVMKKNVGLSIKAGAKDWLNANKKDYKGVAVELTNAEVAANIVVDSNAHSIAITEAFVKDNLDVSYENNNAIGTAKVTVAFKATSNYKGDTVSETWTIQKGTIASVKLVKANAKEEYNGGEDVIPTITATYTEGGKIITLTQGTDFKVNVTNAKNIGAAAKARVQFINVNVTATTGDVAAATVDNVSGEITFTIGKKDIAKDDVVASIDDQVYTGEALKPAINIAQGNYALKAGTDYTVTWQNNTEVGTGAAVLTGTGTNYEGTKVVLFNIKSDKKVTLSASNITLSKYKYIWNGKTRKPAVTVVVDGKTLVRNTDYKVAWYDNTTTGIGRVVVKGIGNYEGRVEVKFEIKPQAPTAMALDAKETGFRVRWTAPALGEFDGYQVVYATDAEFTNIVRTKRITGKEKVTFTGVPAGTYYVKVRAYKDAADGTRVKSLYSNVESITVK